MGRLFCIPGQALLKTLDERIASVMPEDGSLGGSRLSAALLTHSYRTKLGGLGRRGAVPDWSRRKGARSRGTKLHRTVLISKFW